MAENRKAFVFYDTFLEQISLLQDDTQKLKFILAILYYGLKDIEPDFTGIEKALFLGIKLAIDRAQERRLIAIENGKKGADFGKLGGRPPKDDKENPQETPKKPLNANANANASANVNVNENVNANAMHTDNDNNLLTGVDNSQSTGTAPALALDHLENGQNAEIQNARPQMQIPVPEKIPVPETSIDITNDRLVASTQTKEIYYPAGKNYEVFSAAVKKALDSFGWDIAEFNMPKFTDKYFGQKIKNMESLVWEWCKQENLYKEARERRAAKKTDWIKRV